MSVRGDWDLGGGPIPDMTELLEERGIKVLKLPLPRTVDGLTCHVRRVDGDDVPAVVCSNVKSIERQRFTIAHELGHMVLDIPAEVPRRKGMQSFRRRLLGTRTRAEARSWTSQAQFWFRRNHRNQANVRHKCRGSGRTDAGCGHYQRGHSGRYIQRHRPRLEKNGAVPPQTDGESRAFSPTLFESPGRGRDLGIQGG